MQKQLISKINFPSRYFSSLLHSSILSPLKFDKNDNENREKEVNKGYQFGISKQIESTKPTQKTQELAQSVIEGKRYSLSKAITLTESERIDHQIQASHLLSIILNKRNEKILNRKKISSNQHFSSSVNRSDLMFNSNSFRVGITGPPGAGKSTFIEALGVHLCNLGFRVAVLPVDPSSKLSGGSILGDRTRMEELSRQPNAYIRPAPSNNIVGGVSLHTFDAIHLCESAGYEIILVETVGVGQSEVAVGDLTDFFLLLLPPGGGDQLQGIKKGVVELVDLVVINKCDGDLVSAAKRIQRDYQNALHLLRPKSLNWIPEVLLCSSFDENSVAKVWETAMKFRSNLIKSGEFESKRKDQRKIELWTQINQLIIQNLKERKNVRNLLRNLDNLVSDGILSTREASFKILDSFFEDVKKN
ncbi:methylmalonyl-coa mutase [Anaeramoeba ignava]|uniref:Methylmalonyl-coa mutase n=1 Tax=Anaeramoeba ignava TaxID=1746090 RepID=A0A9Q0LXG5_ANAIG|nr:methylmalonyl-coa mutase [Anaeramoeba ignava]